MYKNNYNILNLFNYSKWFKIFIKFNFITIYKFY